MRCPLRDQLHEQQNAACQAEAMATIELRHDMVLISQHQGISQVSQSVDKHQQIEEAILSSRKQQLKIRSQIEKHKTLAHYA